MPDQKTMWTRCLSGFSVMWVTKLLISPGKIRIFCPKLAFLFILGRLIWRPVGGLVGGCGARTVSRKTSIYLYFMSWSAWKFSSSASTWSLTRFSSTWSLPISKFRATALATNSKLPLQSTLPCWRTLSQFKLDELHRMIFRLIYLGVLAEVQLADLTWTCAEFLAQLMIPCWVGHPVTLQSFLSARQVKEYASGLFFKKSYEGQIGKITVSNHTLGFERMWVCHHFCPNVMFEPKPRWLFRCYRGPTTKTGLSYKKKKIFYGILLLRT